MDRQNRSFIERIIKSRKAQRRLKRIVALMAVFVLLWTTDALKMFASTMESESALDKVDVVEATAAEEAIFGEEDDGAEEALLGDEAVDIDDDLDDQGVEDVALDASLDSEDAEGSAEELTDVLLSDVSGDDPEDAEAFEEDAAEPGVYAVNASGEGFKVEVIVDGGEPLPAGTTLAAQWAETVEGRSGAVAQLCRALGVEGNTLPENMGAAFLNQSLLYAGGQIQPDGYVYVNVDLSDTVEIEGDAPDFRVVCLSDGTARVLGLNDFGVTLSGNHVKDFWYYDYAVTEVALVWTTAAHEAEVVEEEAPEVVEVVEDDAEVIADAAIEAVTADINNEETPAAVVEEAEPEETEEADEAESEPEETENNETGEDEAAEVVEIEEEETAETEPEETEDEETEEADAEETEDEESEETEDEEAEEEPEVTEDEEGEEADAEETEDEASEEIEEGEEADAEETEDEESEEEPEETEDEETEEAEPVTVAASADGIVVTIAGEIPAEAIPAAQLIEVDEAAAQAIDALLGEGAAENAVAFDITLTYEGEAIQPNGPVDVTVGIEAPIEMQAGEEGFRLVTLNGENSAVADAAFDSADALTGFAYTTDALGAVAVVGAPVVEEAEEIEEEPADEPEEEPEETEEEEAPAEPAVLYAEIDLTDAVPPLSLREMMAQAAPAAEEAAEAVEPAEEVEEEAEAAEEVAGEPVEEVEEEADAEVAAADWLLTFDEELFAVEPVEDDWLVTPLVNFESAEITVEAGEVYVLTLVNCALYEEEPEEPEYPEQAFEASTETMTVTVTAPEGAFPAGTAMSVADVYDTATLDAITGAVEGENVTVKSVKAVDITFTNADGEEIQPLVPISVVMTPVEQPQLSEVQVVHVDGEGSASVVEQDAPVEGEAAPTEAPAVAFTAETFSVYAYVETIVYEYLSSNGQVYEVTVTYGTDANIPEGAKLRVTEFPVDSDEYDYARNAVLADKLAKGEFVDLEDFNLAALDISILNAAGEEIEPEASVKVDLKIKSLPDVENLSEVAGTLEVQHHVEVEDGVVVETVYGGSAEASFDQATNEEVVAAGTVVDPLSVSDEMFIREEIVEDTIDTSFEVDVFSTYTVTWGGYGSGSATVHYGYMDGNTFREFPNGTPSYTPTFNGTYAYLIYDVPGYDYDSTHLNSATGTEIRPMLNVNGNNHQYTTATGNQPNWQNFNNGSNIYVVYKPESHTTGGTPEIDPDDETWPDEEDPESEDYSKPTFGKSSKNNENGTNTIALRIKAAEKPVEKTTPADVIVVFDVSGSMGDDMDGQTRLARAKTATNTMANTLLNGANQDVRMALISFSNSAQTVRTFTDNYNTFTNSVNGLSATGGTNWEKALKIANEMEVREDAATFVVFVTDGDPTFRISRGNVSDSNLDMYNGWVSTGWNQGYYDTYRYYREYLVFGTGSSDDSGRNFDFAVDQVSAIAGANKNFYAIGISDDVTKVQNLTTEGGVDASHAFIASDSTAMENAFKSITEAIKSVLGFGDVEITDGITDLTSTEMEMLHQVLPGSFKYYRYGGEGNKYGEDYAHRTEWTTRQNDGCGAATYDEDSGIVKWDMGEGFQLEDGVTYIVEFTAWPSQEAYDLVADLNNGVKVYEEGHSNSITDQERAQVEELAAPTPDAPGNYALKTNTEEVTAKYKRTTKTGETVSIADQTPLDVDYEDFDLDNMPLESMKLTIKKEFEDDLTAGEDREKEVTLVMQRRDSHQDPVPTFAPYPVPQTGGTPSANIVLNEANNWTYSVYVAPGFEVDGEVLDHGYDFTITEPDIDYHYGLIEEIINPMVVDGEDVYYGDGYLIDDEATISEYTDRSLTAVNRVKSGIDVMKLVYDTNGTTKVSPDTEFTIKGKLLDSNGDPYIWNTGDDENASGAYHKFVPDENGTFEFDGIKYRREIYKGHFADSSNIELKLKAGEFVRFINVPDGSTFEYYEDPSTIDNYTWFATDAKTQHRTSPNGPYTMEGDEQPVVDGQGKASLSTGVVGNKQYSVTFKNKRQVDTQKIEIVKVDADNDKIKLNGVEFQLRKTDGTTVYTEDSNGVAIGTEGTIMTGNKPNSEGPDGWAGIYTLDPGEYRLYETAAATNYVTPGDNDYVTVTVAEGSVTATVAGSAATLSVISTVKNEDVWTITLGNKKATRDITVTKVFEGIDARQQPTDKFKITAAYGETNEDFTITSTTPGDGTAATSPYTWTLKDVPIGSKVTFTETDYEITGYTVTAKVNGEDYTEDGFEYTVTEDETQTVAFVNSYTRDTGTLVVKKVIEPATVVVDEGRTFVVYITNEAGQYMKVETEDGKTVFDEFVTVEEGGTKPGIPVPANGILTIENVPTDTYTVVEDPSDPNVQITGYYFNGVTYDPAAQSDSGEGEEGDDTDTEEEGEAANTEAAVVIVNKNREATATVTNSYIKLVKVTVKKVVEGLASDKTLEFVFKATLDAADPETFNLKNYKEDADLKVFDGLLPGSEIVITETGVTSNTVTLNEFDTVITTVPAEAGDLGNRTITLTVPEEDEVTITFTNTRNEQELKIKKVDLDGNLITSDTAKFNLYKAENWDANTRKPKTGEDGAPVAADYSFETRNGLSEAASLPVGTYYLVETKAPAGYNLLPEEIVITVSATGVTYGSNSEPASQDSDGAYIVEVTNNPGKILPSTGGIGTTIMYATGTALILLAIAMFIRGSRRRWNGEE